jgi:DNA-3-methyladenine glycosylase II
LRGTAGTAGTAVAAGGPARAPSSFEIGLDQPFRLDLTVSALRRLPSNLVDVYTSEKEYLHAYTGARGPLVIRVSQPDRRTLAVEVDGGPCTGAEHEDARALVRRTLGVDSDVREFARSSAGVPWLQPLARRLRGLRPPRYRSLWEAFVNAIVFQQVSLHAASSVVRRMILACGTPVESRGAKLYLFPDAERVLAEPDDALRALGLSQGKVSTLRRAGEAIASGALSEALVESRSSAEAAELLRAIKGIGPWTASVILLRGFGRLDVFPMNDSGVARNLALAAGQEALEMEPLLETLGAYQGMLYFHLLLARLETRGEIGIPSAPAE